MKRLKCWIFQPISFLQLVRLEIYKARDRFERSQKISKLRKLKQQRLSDREAA